MLDCRSAISYSWMFKRLLWIGILWSTDFETPENESDSALSMTAGKVMIMKDARVYQSGFTQTYVLGNDFTNKSQGQKYYALWSDIVQSLKQS